MRRYRLHAAWYWATMLAVIVCLLVAIGNGTRITAIERAVADHERVIEAMGGYE